MSGVLCPSCAAGRCGPCGRPGTRRAASTSLLGLAPGGVCLAGVSPRRRCALTAPFHPCRRRDSRAAPALRRFVSVALSRGFPRVGPPTTLPFGVRTFLEGAVFSPAPATARPAGGSLGARAGAVQGWAGPAPACLAAHVAAPAGLYAPPGCTKSRTSGAPSGGRAVRGTAEIPRGRACDAAARGRDDHHRAALQRAAGLR